MPYKITKNGIPKDVFDQVRKEFTKGGKNANAIRAAIQDDMAAGVSPVEGKTWDKYSDSYKETIRGNKTFRKVGGKVKVFNGPDATFMEQAAKGGGKSVSPVNLKLSGGLWKSLKVSTTGRVITIAFEHFLAKIHNDEGASKKGVIRRILPTNKGEFFNAKIWDTVLDGVKLAVDTVVNRINRQ